MTCQMSKSRGRIQSLYCQCSKKTNHICITCNGNNSMHTKHTHTHTLSHTYVTRTLHNTQAVLKIKYLAGSIKLTDQCSTWTIIGIAVLYMQLDAHSILMLHFDRLWCKTYVCGCACVCRAKNFYRSSFISETKAKMTHQNAKHIHQMCSRNFQKGISRSNKSKTHGV